MERYSIEDNQPTRLLLHISLEKKTLTLCNISQSINSSHTRLISSKLSLHQSGRYFQNIAQPPFLNLLQPQRYQP